MRKFATIVPAMIILFSFTLAQDAEARKKVRHGARYCQGDHLHYGSSSGHKTRRHAMRAAIESWAGFTVFEYGSEWGHWRLSINRKVSCGRNKAREWACSIQSTPCRRAKRGEKGKYK